MVRWMLACVTAESTAPGVSVRLGRPVLRTFAAGEALAPDGIARRRAIASAAAHRAGLTRVRLLMPASGQLRGRAREWRWSRGSLRPRQSGVYGRWCRAGEGVDPDLPVQPELPGPPGSPG